MLFHLSQKNSIINKMIAQLRNVQLHEDRLRFRKNMERLAICMAYEISKTLRYEEVSITTPLGISETDIPSDRVVIASILRAGLAMHEGFLEIFDDADSAFISSYRKHHKDGSFEVNLEYVTCPNLENSVLILADPMVATGASIDSALEALLEYGEPRKIHIATAIASTNGIDHLRRKHKNAIIWAGDIDEELTAKSYIVPGLGDAGDLAFGPKLQE